MTKKIILILTLCCLLISCCKKGDPEFKESKNNSETDVTLINKT